MLRQRVLASLVALASASASSALADVVVLKSGQSYETTKPAVVKNGQAILTLKNGSLLSIPANEIDQAKTAERRAAMSAPATPAPAAEAKPQSAGDLVKMKGSGRKAAISISDKDVARTIGSEEPAAAAAGGAANIELGQVTVSSSGTGFKIEGAIVNSGKGRALGVSLGIEGFAEGDKSVATGSGSLSKSTLEPGERVPFVAVIETGGVAIRRWRYSPQWRAEAPAGAPVVVSPTPTPAPADAAAAPAAAPAPAAVPTRVPQPDVASPAANAQVGNPTQPGGLYLPPPSSDQPKPPGN
ncbi:MAG: hypothetical protein JNK60_08010 [Acidobacteria bacterium]|nr:hypothetical protein [Acidobacteriota bacterium]